MKIKQLIMLISILLIILSILLSIYKTNPPTAIAANAPISEFSALRAFNRLKIIAQKPHPVGSAEHDKVRDYIINELNLLGLTPEIQKNTAAKKWRDSSHIYSEVENITCKLPGNSNGNSILIVSHYDTAPTSPGAGDAGSSVAAMLETITALKKSPQLKNDVVFLFTDAEEPGLLGATTYAEDKNNLHKIKIVFNFDARGTSGPAIMFETSNNNGELIKEFAKAVPYPVANSLSYEAYKRMPNDTDFTVFKAAGLPGLNFAFIEKVNYYHTQLDNIDNINPNSIQHHGSYMLNLIKHFGNIDLGFQQEGNRIYFDVLGYVLIHYPASNVLILNILTILLLLVVIVIGIKRSYLNISGVVAGFGLFLLSTLVSVVGVSLLWWLIKSVRNGAVLVSQTDQSLQYIFLLSSICFMLVLNITLFNLFRRKFTTFSLFVGNMIWWGILMFFVGWFMPGASYLLTIPFLFIDAGLLVFVLLGSRQIIDPGILLLFSIASIPGIILMTPIIYVLFAGLSFNGLLVIAVLVSLLFTILLPHFEFISHFNRVWPVGGGLILGIILLLVGIYLTRANNNRPRQNIMIYVKNGDNAKAIWAGLGDRPDEWQSQFLGNNIERGSLDEYTSISVRTWMKSSAPLINDASPVITKIDDSIRDGKRYLHLNVNSPRSAQSIIITANSGIIASTVNGKKLNNDPNRNWKMYYYGITKNGFDLMIESTTTAKLHMRVSDISYGLPRNGLPQKTTFKERPEYLIPSTLPFTDTTIITKSFDF